jgi:hypothetical protein
MISNLTKIRLNTNGLISKKTQSKLINRPSHQLTDMRETEKEVNKKNKYQK